ncbi:MAG TPA: hypothetical protein VMR17_00655, partial [Xanthobacteraceae bacterium]|nr:hypothetical protein [Xanthobacteraceae bacterium]
MTRNLVPDSRHRRWRFASICPYLPLAHEGCQMGVIDRRGGDNVIVNNKISIVTQRAAMIA